MCFLFSESESEIDWKNGFAFVFCFLFFVFRCVKSVKKNLVYLVNVRNVIVKGSLILFMVFDMGLLTDVCVVMVENGLFRFDFV